MKKTPTPISEYNKKSFAAIVSNKHEITHDVYTRGTGKKVVVIIQELPGIGQETLALADKFVKEKYKVILPHLFGVIGKTQAITNLYKVFCMRKEFKLFAKNQSSPIVDWLKALCKKVKEEEQVKGVATIGMCLTGNFAISLMADESVIASFASQPSLPLLGNKALHMSEEEVEKIKTRLDDLPPMYCGRFEKDWICKAQKFDAINQIFNTDKKERIKLHTLPGKAHSILTLDFVDEEGHPTQKALKEIIEYFDKALS